MRNSINECMDNSLGFTVRTSNITGNYQGITCCIANTRFYKCNLSKEKANEL